MHLFFNDPRVAYVTRHRRIMRHPLVALVVGGVGVAALGVAIGAAGWEAPQQGGSAPQQAQQGMAMADPVQDVNLYGVPAAPQPVLDLGPPRTLTPPQQPAQKNTNPNARANAKAKANQVKRAEKAKTPVIPAPPTQEPTLEPTPEPTPEPTVEPTVEPTLAPTLEPATRHPRWPWRHRGPWEQQEQDQSQTPGVPSP